MNGGVSEENNKAVEQIIGKRIQIIRKSKGFTQQQFAEKIGLSTNYISDIERGKRSARLEAIIYYETAKPYTEMDDGLVTECVD